MDDSIIKIAVFGSQKQFLIEIKEMTEECMLLLDIKYEINLYGSLSDLFGEFENREYDIILFSMEMPDFSNVGETILQIRNRNVDSITVLITDYIDYGPREFEINRYRYIPKKQLNKILPETYKFLCGRIIERKRDETYYTIESGSLFKSISYREIYYLKKAGNDTEVFYKEGHGKQKRDFAEVLNEFKEKTYFSILGKKYIINILHVMSFKGNQIHLRNGCILPVNNIQLKQIRKDILDYWKIN